MGTWGTGLYSSDFAADLQPIIKAVVRLPFAPERLLEILRESVGTVSHDSSDEDYTIFWLVMADQFHKRGIELESVFSTAIRLIDEGADLAMAKSLGMSKADLNKRSKALSGLRNKIASPLPEKKRATISKPEPLLMDAGDLLIYPVSKSGNCRNPYMPPSLDDWKAEKWGACLILRTGRAFGFFPWYQFAKLVDAQPQAPRPGTEMLLSPTLNWCIAYPGSCNATRFKRMQLTKLRSFHLQQGPVDALLSNAEIGADKIDDCAIEDRCISNDLDVRCGTDQRALQGLVQLILDD